MFLAEFGEAMLAIMIESLLYTEYTSFGETLGCPDTELVASQQRTLSSASRSTCSSSVIQTSGSSQSNVSNHEEDFRLVYSSTRRGLPEFDFVAFRIHNPTELAKLAVFDFFVHFAALFTQQLEQCVEVIDPVVDHEA